MAEEYEDEIEDWYFNHQDKDLMTYLCANRALRKDDKSEIFLSENVHLPIYLPATQMRIHSTLIYISTFINEI